MNNIKQSSMAGLFPAIIDIPENIRLKAPLFQRNILINGELREWKGPSHTVTSPIHIQKNDGTTEPLLIGSYPLATTTEAEEALEAAVKAFDRGRGKWPSMSMQERIEHLEDFTAKMLVRKEEIVKLIVWEIGKTIPDAEKEFDRTVDYINETIKAAGRLNNLNLRVVISNHFIGHNRKVPYGVVLCMGPFNYPLNETFTTLIPALIMGNTILFKPPKHGTLLFAPLLEAFVQAFPKGVVNTVYGRGRDTAPTLMESGKVDVLALIGSSKVADSLKKMHPKSNRLKAVLGLDAKNAAIVMPDADIDLAVKECVAGALSFNGQRCTALKILYVHQDIVDEFNAKLVEEVNKLKVGMPWDKGVTITPLAEPDKPDFLANMVAEAIEKGARVINRKPEIESGYASLVQPTVLFPVNSKMSIFHQEQFGPIIPVVPFMNINMPVDSITESPYGQQVSIFSENFRTVSKMVDLLNMQVGRVNVNSQCQRSPDSFAFGGRKDSAEGTLSIEEALLAFSTDSVVATKDNPSNQKIFEDILMENQSSRLNTNCVMTNKN
ncbi:nonphosphorylating glyceraldehyde-3-phosphate dehydrogenase [Flavobacterium sp. 270]|uniref:NADP-dependent glyceraldehyde-3-phosphate dehydrogenase n=1 Tax=Flavobacterium sp. 270 TaxID=2512114 RepID=UPI001066A0D4|nr:NADP-dependent glyceraldehyde-3-phosphate dehydrogenase [Flavobacterium sp. 270]TDW51593.1 nonphosphorylating glyceraldehyde-3-phosphate dehydrogenase [Flavobacterium sp. 270]